MGWDAGRPVPWSRMVREWAIYVVIMIGIVVVFFRDRPLFGIVVGLLVSGPLYLGLGYVLAKLGYQRKSWSELRSESAGRDTKRNAAVADAPPGPRPKAAPTSRTGGSGPRPKPRRR